MTPQEITQLKDKLRTLMRKPPLYVINGSYQMAVAYKENYLKAQRVLNKANPKPQELLQCLNLMGEK
jgi:hypothetical protein